MTQQAASSPSNKAHSIPPHRLRSRRADRSLDSVTVQLRRAQLCRTCRRYARFGARRQRRSPRRPLIQISPPARHFHRRARRAQRTGRTARRKPARTQHARHDGRAIRWPCRCEPKSLAVARLRCDGGQRLALALFPGRLLLQDLHVAAELLGEGVRAGDPPRRGPWTSGAGRRSR